MEDENKDGFQTIDDPFGSGRKVGVVKPLHPDISLAHGAVADPYGNTIVLSPHSEGLWGVKASRGGVVVTVEKIVSTDFIRRHQTLVKIPGYLVKSVSVAPFGSHPGAMSDSGLEGLDVGYGEDYEFIKQYRAASRKPDTLDAWVKEWVLDCRTHEGYLQKLGPERLIFLKGKADKDAWRYELEPAMAQVPWDKECSPSELMAIVAARKLKERVLKGGYKLLLSGVGVATTAAWLAYYQLKKAGVEIENVAEMGMYGFAPRPGDAWTFSFSNLSTCKMTCGFEESLGYMVSGLHNSLIAALGAGQIDKYGNLNTTQTGQLYLGGSGGGNDIASAAIELIVLVAQSRQRLVDQVPYITSPGQRVRTLVSTLGVFEKIGEEAELTLTGYFPQPGLSREAAINRIANNCGWKLKVAKDIEAIAPPAREELDLVRIFDPYGLCVER